MNTGTKELNLNEMEQVSGGIVWLIPVAVAAACGVYAIVKAAEVLSK